MRFSSWKRTHLEQLLQARSYRLSGLPRVRIGLPQRLWLRQHDRYGRLLARVRMNGWRLVIGDILARLLRLQRWERRLRLQLNAIEVKHLK